MWAILYSTYSHDIIKFVFVLQEIFHSIVMQTLEVTESQMRYNVSPAPPPPPPPAYMELKDSSPKQWLSPVDYLVEQLSHFLAEKAIVLALLHSQNMRL